jgi:hypothetical protein
LEQTLAAVKAFPGGVRMLIIDYCEERIRFLRSLGGKTGFSANGRGWTIRVTGKDPKGQYKAQLGVVGNALWLAAAKNPLESQTSAGSAKAESQDKGIGEVLKKREAWGRSVDSCRRSAPLLPAVGRCSGRVPLLLWRAWLMESTGW